MAVFTSGLFLDGISTAIPPSLVYLPSSTDDGEYVTSSLPNPAVTSATQRMGTPIIRQTVSPKVFETTDVVGGVRLGNVTVFENGEPADQIDMKTFNGFRAGKNINTFLQFGGATNIRPMIRVSPEGLFEKNDSDKINHFASFNSFGMGLHYKTVDENYELIPFNDFSKLVATDLIGKESVFAYPFVHNGIENLKQFTDPSHPGNDGAVDVFEVRYSLANLSPADIRLYGCRGDYQGGGIESNRKGSTSIDSKREVNVKSNALFLDAQEVQFANFSFPQIGVTGSSGFKFPLPGFVDDSKYVLSPFDDGVDYIKNSYTFKSLSMESFLSSSRNSISEIGTRFKSTTCGLVYGESNVLGTDSIAFGGLKK